MNNVLRRRTIGNPQNLAPSRDAICPAAKDEAEAMTALKDKLVHNPKQLLAIMRRSGGVNRLPELLSKVRELESHSRGGPYERVLESMRGHLEAAQAQAKGSNEAESQCALFGENFLLKPLVHYLSCWDVRERKKLREEVDFAVRVRDKAYDESIALVSEGNIARAREAEEKCLESGEKALVANAKQRDALRKLERAACMDLEAYRADAAAFVSKWESMYETRLETVQDDISVLSDATKLMSSRQTAVEQSFKTQLHDHAKRLADNAARRAKNMKALREILQSEIERERELKEEELALTLLQHEVEEWKKTKQIAQEGLGTREEELMQSEEILMNAMSVVNHMRQAEEELNDSLDTQLNGRKDALEKEKLRLAGEHFELATYELKALTRKGDRLRRRAEILEQKRADCFFTVEMAYENATPVEEVRAAQNQANRYAQETDMVRKQLEGLAALAQTVDNEDLQSTISLLGVEHPQRDIRDALQKERDEYNEKVRQHLTAEMSALGQKSVHYIRQTPRELDEITDHHVSDLAADKATRLAMFSPPNKSSPRV